MSARSLVRIDFACNDPDSGTFIGRVSQIQLAGDVLELEAVRWNLLSFRGCPTIRFGQRAVTLSGKTWPTVRRTGWYGNWCWDAVWMLPADALDFLAWLHRGRRWRASMGDDVIFDAWNMSEALDWDARPCGEETLREILLAAVAAEQARS